MKPDETPKQEENPQPSVNGKPALGGQSELQKIRREILMLSDRAKKLATRIDVLITQQGQE